MKIECYKVGALLTNSYCVAGEDFAFIVDPADSDERLIAFAKQNKSKSIKYILLTHGHFDHVLGVEAIKGIWGCPLVIGCYDTECLKNPELNLSAMFSDSNISLVADVLKADGDIINLGEAEISVMHTPGHTKGSVCYILDDIIFSGDTLFKGTIGRTDFPTSDTMAILSSLKRLSALEKDYKIYPGHNSETTLFYEKKYNQFMRF